MSSCDKPAPHPCSPPTIFEQVWTILSVGVTWVVRVFVFVCMVGFLANLVLSKVEKRSIAQLGYSMETGDKHGPLNVFCSGDSSQPLLVFVPDTSYVTQLRLLQLLSTRFRVCSYDRAGRLWRYHYAVQWMSYPCAVVGESTQLHRKCTYKQNPGRLLTPCRSNT